MIHDQFRELVPKRNIQLSNSSVYLQACVQLYNDCFQYFSLDGDSDFI